MYWTWNGKVILPFYRSEQDVSKATKLSLKYLFDHGSDVNAIFNTKCVKNQTLFNMINQNKNVRPTDSMQMLIDYKFDFETLINVYDNVKHRNGLLQLCKGSSNYESVKMLFNHCKTLGKCKIDIAHCDTRRENALFYAAITDVNTFKYFLSNEYFPNNHEMDDKNVKIALNQKNNQCNTLAHSAASNPRPHIVDTFKLLKEHNFNFNVYNYRGRLPIHNVCEKNCASLLSWMINENVFDSDINCETKYGRNKNYNGQTPLYIAVINNSDQCVDVLCKQTENIDIKKEDIYCALKNDYVKILKFLLCGLFIKCHITNWNDIQSLQSSNMISSQQIKSITLSCKSSDKNKRKECYQFLNNLYTKGYLQRDFKHIVFKLDYNLKTVMTNNNNNGNDEIKQNHEISSLYQITENLGNGTFGQVKLGKHKKTGDKVAIKYIETSSSATQLIASEIESLKKLSTHENIIDLLNYVIHKEQVLLYFEYCQYGDLYILLNQCDHFSMRISFKYFLQLLNAINACHKMNIVHRDLKLQNILLSDTFQLKVADFGLASIVDNKNNDTIYNVGTPMYKSPELIEAYTSEYDISNIVVLKSCDVFSLSIIFWQMMNGIEYLPFKCYKSNGINDGNYGLIKTKQFDKFWNVHKKCNMISSNRIQLLCDLFEHMFDYNPNERIIIDSVLKHKFVTEKENDPLFRMNDTTLEAFVRDRYHQTKNSKRKHTLSPQTYYHDNDPKYETSGIFPWLLQDSSQAQVSPNTSRIHADNDKIIYSFNPLVVMVGIENKKENNQATKANTIDRTATDYINVEQMLHDIKHFDIIYHDKNHQLVYLTKNGQNDKVDTKNNNDEPEYKDSVLFNHETCTTTNSMIEREFAFQWTIKDLDKFNDQIFDILQNSSKYDSLIYIISCDSSKHYLSNGKSISMLYDSLENKYCCNEKIFDKFNNGNCSNLEKKAKIFVIDSDNTIVNNSDNNNNNSKDDVKIDYVDQYRRVIYANTSYTNINYNTDNNNSTGDVKQDDKNDNDGGLLINSFCVSLCNNVNNINSSQEDDKNIKDLNDIIKETESRIKKFNASHQVYDENLIPDRRQIVFTSFQPLQSTKYIHLGKNNNNGMIETVADLSLKQSNTAHTPEPVNDYDATK